jgi:anti-sigma factor RsiW
MREWVKCEDNEQVSMWMSLALDDLLDADGRQRLQQHLDMCPACQQEWDALRQADALFEMAPMMAPPLGFAVRVERRLEERVRKRHQLFGGVAVLTGSLSLAGMTAAAVVLIGLAVLVWRSFGSFPALQLGTSAAAQIVSGVGLMGEAASFFLADLLLHYGPPLILCLSIGLTVLLAIWTWLLVKRPGRSRHNGYV